MQINIENDMNHRVFTWDSLGDIEMGRGDLGVEMPVLVYRLMQYTMMDVMSKELGRDKANDFFRKAGYLAGKEFASNVMDLSMSFNSFIADLQKKLKQYKIGILRMESFDPNTGNIVLTVSEDLDCSGLPISGETVCVYDEGYIAGILEAYTGKAYHVREIDCWANGNRICRFNCERIL